MLLGQLDQIPNASGAGVESNRAARKEQPACECGRLDERKPILSNPLVKPHCVPIVSGAPIFVIRALFSVGNIRLGADQSLARNDNNSFVGTAACARR